MPGPQVPALAASLPPTTGSPLTVGAGVGPSSMNNLAQVVASTVPSSVRPATDWNCLTEASVVLPSDEPESVA